MLIWRALPSLLGLVGARVVPYPHKIMTDFAPVPLPPLTSHISQHTIQVRKCCRTRNEQHSQLVGLLKGCKVIQSVSVQVTHVETHWLNCQTVTSIEPSELFNLSSSCHFPNAIRCVSWLAEPSSIRVLNCERILLEVYQSRGLALPELHEHQQTALS